VTADRVIAQPAIGAWHGARCNHRDPQQWRNSCRIYPTREAYVWHYRKRTVRSGSYTKTDSGANIGRPPVDSGQLRQAAPWGDACARRPRQSAVRKQRIAWNVVRMNWLPGVRHRGSDAATPNRAATVRSSTVAFRATVHVRERQRHVRGGRLSAGSLLQASRRCLRISYFRLRPASAFQRIHV